MMSSHSFLKNLRELRKHTHKKAPDRSQSFNFLASASQVLGHRCAPPHLLCSNFLILPSFPDPSTPLLPISVGYTYGLPRLRFYMRLSLLSSPWIQSFQSLQHCFQGYHLLEEVFAILVSGILPSPKSDLWASQNFL